MLNVYFSDAGYLGSNPFKLGQLVITNGPLAGKTVYELITYANTAIGGCSTPYSVLDLKTAADNINNNFDNGTQDLGYLTCPASQPVTIGDKLWIDANKNGIQDNGELGFAGATVQLYDCNNNLKATTTTDANGVYTFSNITPGSYYVKFTLPANYAFTLQNQGSNDAVDSDVDPATGKTTCNNFTSGTVDLTWDAGIYFAKANLGDRVWNDKNENGIQDDAVTEPGISGVTVSLYKCDNTFMSSTVTDGNGNFLFSNLTPGSYYIMVTLPAGYSFSPKLQGTDITKDSDIDPVTGKSACVTLNAGDNNLTVDAGIHSTHAAIGNYVWNDLNKNGIQDANEPGMAGVTVKLFDCANTLKGTTTTDTAGLYKFSDLIVGDYYLQFTLPANFSFTLKNQGTDPDKDSDPDVTTGKTSCTTLSAGETDLTWDAGMYFNKASLGDKVWNDINENGIQDNGEAGVPNVELKLYDCSNNNLIATTTTDANGLYLFANLAPGSYFVKVTIPTGYVLSAKNQGSDPAKDNDFDPISAKTSCVTLNAGDNDLTKDAGIHISKVTIGDFVWNDIDHDGIQDGNESGIPGVTVKLYDCSNAFIASTVTDGLGKYAFANLPAGDYYVQFILPAGYVFTAKNQGGDITKDSDADPLTGKTACATLPPGTVDLTKDAGMYVPTASVGDKVWNDLNHDGYQDNPVSELGIPGVVVKLYTCSGALVFTSVTDQNGNYLFSNLQPGDYKIQFMLPEGFAFSMPYQGVDTSFDSDANPGTGYTACFTLQPGQNDLTRDAGMYYNRVSIGDFVWKDINKNGIQDNGESGLGGVTVRLFNCSDVVFATTVTDNLGYYSFTNLLPGDYYVQFFLPSGYSFSPRMQGANISLDSDPDVLTGKTSCTTVSAGQNIVTWDAGMYETQSTFADLALLKTANVSNAQNNDLVTYTLTLTNNGPQTATGVTVSDILPVGVDYISCSPSGAYDPNTGIWTVGSIANGAVKTLTITVKVNTSSLSTAVIDLGPAKPFNMFVLEDMIVPSSDTQGKLAVGRDAHLQGYSVGDQLPVTTPPEDVLIVGRDLTFLTGRVYNGNVVYGHATNLPRYSVSIDEGTLRQGYPIDFATAANYLNALSTALFLQPVNGLTEYQPYNEVTMTGTDPYLNVFSVDGSRLSTANNTSITVPNGSVVLVNISGHIDSWGYGLNVAGTAYSNALFNFYEADSLFIHGIDVTGSILAPRANVYFLAGVQHGQMICKSYRGQGQLNLDPFVGNLPVSRDIINIAEVRTSDNYDPNSSPGNGNTSENDYSQAIVHIGVPAPSSPSFHVVGSLGTGNGPLTITNNTAGQVLAGTTNGKVLLSTNNGTNWTTINSTMSVGKVWTISTSASKAANIVIGTDKGVYRTANNGATWDSTNLLRKDVRSIVTLPNGAMVAGTWGNGVYRSVDNGQSWFAMNTGLTNLQVNSLYADNAGDIFAATFGGGIFRYSVMNDRWTSTAIPYQFVWTIHATHSRSLYATTYGGGIYRSVDGGANWTAVNSGLTNLYIYSLTEDNNNNLIAISFAGGIFSTPEGTNNWRNLGLQGAEISALHINSVSGSIYVGTKSGAIYTKDSPLDVKNPNVLPTEYTLSQNYPNPFNPSTKINFTVPLAGQVTLSVFNVLGQEVRRLIDNEYQPGSYSVNFDAKELSTGVYIYRLTAKNISIVKKMMLVK